jgi:hypothetical protein
MRLGSNLLRFYDSRAAGACIAAVIVGWFAWLQISPWSIAQQQLRRRCDGRLLVVSSKSFYGFANDSWSRSDRYICMPSYFVHPMVYGVAAGSDRPVEVTEAVELMPYIAVFVVLCAGGRAAFLHAKRAT